MCGRLWLWLRTVASSRVASGNSSVLLQPEGSLFVAAEASLVRCSRARTCTHPKGGRMLCRFWPLIDGIGARAGSRSFRCAVFQPGAHGDRWRLGHGLPFAGLKGSLGPTRGRCSSRMALLGHPLASFHGKLTGRRPVRGAALPTHRAHPPTGRSRRWGIHRRPQAVASRKHGPS